MAPFGWARCTDATADILRRGAWYPIVEQTSEHVVLEVDRQPVRVSRTGVRVRPDQPDRWSIVVRTGVLRPTWSGNKVVTTYAVCPDCRSRQEFEGKPETLVCQRCRRAALVDWSETC